MILIKTSRILKMNKKLSIFALGLLNLSTVIHASPHTSLDLTPILQDHFEKKIVRFVSSLIFILMMMRFR
jgi:hypothetical protein